MDREAADDTALLARVAAGDESAFRDLYGRHHSRVYRFSSRMAGPTIAEDVVQECFLSLLRRPFAYDPGRACLGTYLCAIARHLVWRELRRNGASHELDASDEADLPSLEIPPDETLTRQETSEQVKAAIASLPPLQREALVLFEYEGLSLAEIGEVVGAEVGTVSARLHRARERLRRQLRHLLPTRMPVVDGVNT